MMKFMDIFFNESAQFLMKNRENGKIEILEKLYKKNILEFLKNLQNPSLFAKTVNYLNKINYLFQ